MQIQWALDLCLMLKGVDTTSMVGRWIMNCSCAPKGTSLCSSHRKRIVLRSLKKGRGYGEARVVYTMMVPWFQPFGCLNNDYSIRVRLLNLPLHLWPLDYLEIIGNSLHLWPLYYLEIIGNSLGRFVKTDTERISNGLSTFANICVKLDLSKGFFDKILLIGVIQIPTDNS